MIPCDFLSNMADEQCTIAVLTPQQRYFNYHLSCARTVQREYTVNVMEDGEHC